jgi:hypothetical protein
MSDASLEERIKQLGAIFVGRLDRPLLDSALNYCEFREYTLALEMLCDHLFEHDVEIAAHEFDELRDLCRVAKADGRRCDVLEALVR